MFRQLVPLVSRKLTPQRVCCFCARTHTSVQSPKWKIATAVCVERYPVITQEMTDLEKKYYDLMMKLDVERSLLSDHEDQIRKERMKVNQKDEDTDVINVMTDGETVTALDKEDAWETEYKNYNQFAERKHAMDNNLQSSSRKLDKKLVLIVQYKFGDNLIWCLPQAYYNKEDSLKETAEKILQECLGKDLKFKIFSNAPSGMYQYMLPKNVEDGKTGVKLFIYRADFKGGKISITNKNICDYRWVTLEELTDYLKPAYEKELKKFVLEF